MDDRTGGRSTYQPNQPYVQAQDADDRNHVVPPAKHVLIDRKVMLQIPNSLDQSQFDHYKYGNPEFLAAIVRSYDLSMEYEISEWSYGKRWTAQHILPFMLLGPMSFARNENLVREAGVTMMVAVRSKRIAEARPTVMDPAKFASAQGIQTATFDIDTPYDVITGRSSILEKINNHLETSCAGRPLQELVKLPGKVLVFCETGNDRSPILPALYLMVIWGLDAFSAVHIVQARRFGIDIPLHMIKMLRDVEEILQAERQVARTRESTPALSKHAQKRSIDEADGSEVGNPGSEYLQFEELQSVRIGVAPFRDSNFALD